MCGEKCAYSSYPERMAGSPPRVRGKGTCDRTADAVCRITPACAGKSVSSAIFDHVRKDHPRVCGEKAIWRSASAMVPGSPPRVRGKGHRSQRHHRETGITPACAGKSQPPAFASQSYRDHPRVCGEKKLFAVTPESYIGSPPRVRGKGFASFRDRDADRITPACAGKRKKEYSMESIREDHPRVCGEKTKKIPFNAPKTAFSSVLCQISFNFSYSMSVNVQSARARCVSLISIPKCRHKSCNV